MKDSQRQLLAAFLELKYIKANNERFSTEWVRVDQLY